MIVSERCVETTIDCFGGVEPTEENCLYDHYKAINCYKTYRTDVDDITGTYANQYHV